MPLPHDRTALYQLLLALPNAQFEALLFDLNPPKGNLSPPTAPRGQRVPELLDWLESPVGPGLDALKTSLETVLGTAPTQDVGPALPLKVPFPAFRWLSRKGFMLALASGFAAASLVSVVRFFGAFERLELMAYDHVLTARPPEPISDRIIVLEANQAVANAERAKEPKNLTENLSDATLTATLQKLQEYGASVIGVDWYLPAEPNWWSDEALAVFQASAAEEKSPIYGVCFQPYEGRTGEINVVPAPHSQAIPAERVGFSNFAIDGSVDPGGQVAPDSDTVRRHLVSNGLGDTVATPPCPSTQAFSTLIALHYLGIHHPNLDPFTPPDLSTIPAPHRNRLNLGRTLLNGIPPRNLTIYGGYHSLHPGAFELMLNYRDPPGNNLRAAFTHKSIYDLIENRLDPAAFAGKVVLLGLTDDTRISDRFLTPYGSQSGVTIQAHMVDHLISLALGERRQIWVWTRGGEFVWILFWGLLGGFSGVLVRNRPWWLTASLMVGLLGIYLSSRLAMGRVALWLPMVPPMVALVLAQGTVVYTESKLQLTRSESPET